MIVSWASFRLRVRLALTPLGASATAWWIMNRLLRTEVYRLMAGPCPQQPTGPPSPFAFHSVSSPEEARALPPALLGQLESQTRAGLAKLTGEGSRLYYLTAGDAVACQLLFQPGPEIRVDMPPGLRLGIGNDGAFLSYMYTYGPFRRMGAGRDLLRRAGEDLGRRGFSFTISHISATNVPSIQTVTRVGWRSIGLMVFSRRGKLLYATSRADRRVTVRFEPRLRRSDGKVS